MTPVSGAWSGAEQCGAQQHITPAPRDVIKIQKSRKRSRALRWISETQIAAPKTVVCAPMK